MANFLGASVHFVACESRSSRDGALVDGLANILVLGIIAVAFVIYRDRNTRGTIGNDLKKKAQ